MKGNCDGRHQNEVGPGLVIKDNPLTSRMRIADFVIDIWPLAGEIGNQKFTNLDFFENAVGDATFVFDVIRGDRGDAEFFKDILDPILYVLQRRLAFIDCHHNEGGVWMVGFGARCYCLDCLCRREQIDQFSNSLCRTVKQIACAPPRGFRARIPYGAISRASNSLRVFVLINVEERVKPKASWLQHRDHDAVAPRRPLGEESGVLGKQKIMASTGQHFHSGIKPYFRRHPDNSSSADRRVFPSFGPGEHFPRSEIVGRSAGSPSPDDCAPCGNELRKHQWPS